MSLAVSAHGTIVARNGDEVPALGDVEGPALVRKPVDDTRHADGDDRWAAGIRRLGPMSFAIDLEPAQLDLFVSSWLAGSVDRYDVGWPDGSGWAFSGVVIDVSPVAPVDGLLAAKVTIQPTGGIAFGAFAPPGFLTLEDGTPLLLEDGTEILLEA